MESLLGKDAGENAPAILLDVYIGPWCVPENRSQAANPASLGTNLSLCSNTLIKTPGPLPSYIHFTSHHASSTDGIAEYTPSDHTL